MTELYEVYVLGMLVSVLIWAVHRGVRSVTWVQEWAATDLIDALERTQSSRKRHIIGILATLFSTVITWTLAVGAVYLQEIAVTWIADGFLGIVALILLVVGFVGALGSAALLISLPFGPRPQRRYRSPDA